MGVLHNFALKESCTTLSNAENVDISALILAVDSLLLQLNYTSLFLKPIVGKSITV